jgi:hypothetical protein
MKLRKEINELRVRLEDGDWLNSSQFAIVHGWDMIVAGHWEHARLGSIVRHRVSATGRTAWWLWRAPGGYRQEFKSLRVAVRKAPEIAAERGIW